MQNTVDGVMQDDAISKLDQRKGKSQMKVTITFADLSYLEASHVLMATAALPVMPDLVSHEPVMMPDGRTLEEAVNAQDVKAAEAAPANPTSTSTPSRRRRISAQPAETIGQPAPSTTAEVKDTGRRRRGGSASETSSSPSSPAVPSEGESAANPTPAPTVVRRSRAGAATTSTPTTTEKDTPAASPSVTPAPVAGRRRRTETTATPASSEKSANGTTDDKITDADLSMAVSQAATKITPKAVMGIMAEYGVTKVNDIKAEQRREFLDHLKDAMKPGN